MKLRDEYRDVNLYSILREDWEALKMLKEEAFTGEENYLAMWILRTQGFSLSSSKA